MSKYGVSSGPYFLIFGLNTGKYGPEKTPYLDTFHAAFFFLIVDKTIKIDSKLLYSYRNNWLIAKCYKKKKAMNIRYGKVIIFQAQYKS